MYKVAENVNSQVKYQNPITLPLPFTFTFKCTWLPDRTDSVHLQIKGYLNIFSTLLNVVFSFVCCLL